MHDTGPNAPAPTLFAPGMRLDRAALEPLIRKVIEDPIVRAILESIPGSVLIVSKERQILAANQEILDALGLKDKNVLAGQRPGEALGCIHSAEGPSGCGTSRHCRACGLVIGLLTALENPAPFSGECTLTILGGERMRCLNYEVYAVALEIGGERCIEVVFHDIGDKKMREALDRVFLHDLRNAVTGLHGWSELMARHDRSADDGAGQLLRISKSVLEMIEGHACLLNAESGDLSPNLSTVAIHDVLETVRSTVEKTTLASKGTLLFELSAEMQGACIRTDRALLGRVLVNMVKNAFEAIDPGRTVSVSARREAEGAVCFGVHNPGVIPEHTQLRMFQRAFSTKGGTGRGFGTYGMKLIGENVLKGRVGFESTAETGTRFWIRLPSEECGGSE